MHFQNPGHDKLWLVTTFQTSVASLRGRTSIAPSLKVDCSHTLHVNLWRHGKEGKRELDNCLHLQLLRACTCSFLMLTLACTRLHLQLPDACLNLSLSLSLSLPLSPHHSPHLVHLLLTRLLLYTTLLRLDDTYNQLLQASGNQPASSSSKCSRRDYLSST